jgi:hypothetical protein
VKVWLRDTWSIICGAVICYLQANQPGWCEKEELGPLREKERRERRGQKMEQIQR